MQAGRIYHISSLYFGTPQYLTNKDSRAIIWFSSDGEGIIQVGGNNIEEDNETRYY